jgi:hypothetical protein
MTDASKSFSIDALTCAGAATLNGAVTLGNATSDDITITGYIASAIVPKTNITYDLGTNALKFRDGYFDGLTLKDGGIDATYTLNTSGSTGGYISSLTNTDGSTGTGLYVQCATSGSGFLARFIGGGGTTDCFSVSTNGATIRFPQLSSGTMTLSSGTVAITSDESQKKDIEDIKPALENVLKLKPRYFRWKDADTFGTDLKVGFIAQEVLPYFPEIVGQNNPSGLLSMHYAEMTAVLTKAIQELKAEVDFLISKIA